MDAKTLGNMPVSALEHDIGGGGKLQCHGITLRQHFAGLAMQGICADSAAVYEGDGRKLALPRDAELIAEAAVAMADALLTELSKEASHD